MVTSTAFDFVLLWLVAEVGRPQPPVSKHLLTIKNQLQMAEKQVKKSEFVDLSAEEDDTLVNDPIIDEDEESENSEDRAFIDDRPEEDLTEDDDRPFSTLEDHLDSLEEEWDEELFLRAREHVRFIQQQMRDYMHRLEEARVAHEIRDMSHREVGKKHK